MIDLNTLFEPRPHLVRFKDLKSELEALQSNEKAMSVFSFPRPSADDNNYTEVLRAALDLGLLVIQHTEKIDLESSVQDHLYLFILNPDQIWRVPAFIATRKILRDYEWSDGAEYLESFLLGYGEDNISQWIENIRNTRVSWTGKTFYMLMTHKQQQSIASLGMRCLDPKSVIEDITAFFSRNQSVSKNNIFELVPKGMVVGRVSVKQPFFRKLFGHPSGWGNRDIVSSLITGEIAISLNSALDSNFQFLDADGWH